MRPMRRMLKTMRGRTSLHTPATGGKAPFRSLNPYCFDTTELPLTDDLYHPTGAIAHAQRLAAVSAGAAHTLLLHGGSTAGIHAMLLYAANRGDTVIFPRNVHISALHLCAIAGIQPVFADVSYTKRARPYTTLAAYEEAMDRAPRAKAVLLLRPDYYGLVADASALARAVHKRGMLLLCDEAHGATFSWRTDVASALACGADITVQSAHKTLPALTAGAWLHTAPGIDASRLRALLRMVQTSSPSFIGLLSLDDARAWMDVNGKVACADLNRELKCFYAQAAALGFPTGQDDAPPGHMYDSLRLVLQAPEGGRALEQALSAYGIDMEMSDECCVVGIPPLQGYKKALHRVLRVLRQLHRDRPSSLVSAHPVSPAKFPPVPMQVLTLDQAAFAPAELVPLAQAAGRISAAHIGFYPPGIALLVAGEAISSSMAAYLEGQNTNCMFGLHADRQVACIQEAWLREHAPEGANPAAT